MKRGLIAAAVVYLFVAAASVGSQGVTPAQVTVAPSPHQALLKQYCITCHNSRTQTGGLALDTVSLDRVEADAEIWEKVIRKVRAGLVPLHRMNRAEYANAIRDLLSLEVDASTLLPADNSTHGFDNIANVLGVSPSLLERYVTAAAKVSRLAVGDREPAPTQVTYTV